MKVHMTFLPLPCHGIDFILSASSLRLMINQHTTIDGKTTNMHAGEKFENMNMQNAKRRSPSPLLAIEESLYPYHSAIGFKQYNPNKPTKYGLLYLILCDLSISYTYFTLPYTGKLEEITEEAAKFYVTGTNEYTKYLVTEFNQYNSIQGCIISMDQYFT